MGTPKSSAAPSVPESNELVSLRATAANLEASIAARDAIVGASADIRSGTDRERRRLAEVEARIKELTAQPQ